MLGWEIFVSRRLPGETLEAPSKESSVGCWHGSCDALRWVDDLVKEGRATELGGNGYPYRYLVAAKDVLPILKAHQNPKDSRARLHPDAIQKCEPDEQLIVEAWDQS